MDSSRIEELLEEISSKLDDVKYELEEANKQLVWYSDGFAGKIVDELHNIRDQIRFKD